MMPSWDAWLHIAELLLVIFIVPGLKKLIGVLIALQESLALLSQTVTTHSEAFDKHVEEDRGHFKDVDTHISDVQGNVRELIGMLRIERRAGFERRDA